MGVFKTSDGKFINLTVLSPGPYIEDVFGHLGIPEAAKDERFSTAEVIMANAAEAYPLVKAAIADRPVDYWTTHRTTMKHRKSVGEAQSEQVRVTYCGSRQI